MTVDGRNFAPLGRATARTSGDNAASRREDRQTTKPPHPHLQCCCSCFGRLGRMEEISHHPRLQEKGRCLATTLNRRGYGGNGKTFRLRVSFPMSKVVRNFFHRPTGREPTTTSSYYDMCASSYHSAHTRARLDKWFGPVRIQRLTGACVYLVAAGQSTQTPELPCDTSMSPSIAAVLPRPPLAGAKPRLDVARAT